MIPRPANPPTTPPAIAPAFDFLDADAEPGPPLPTEVAVLPNPEDVYATVVDTVPVGLVPVAEDSGAERSACAAAALKVSVETTSKYAQAGMEVPDGICSGNWSRYSCVQLVSQALHVSIVRFWQTAQADIKE